MKPQRIDNKDRKFGAALYYFQIGEYVFTPLEIEKAKLRYDNNPEDVLPTPKDTGLYAIIALLLFIIALLSSVLLICYPAILVHFAS